ncbi:MAG TPA: hypothetical protein VFF69_04760 [Phycisphaerales bacterium]|nr:hypothetical protein [Phycisphaerales bacterium]
MSARIEFPFRRFGLVACAVAAAPALAQTPSGSVLRLARLGGQAVEPRAISGDGLWIVGGAHNGSGWQAAVWSSADGSVLIPADSEGATYACVSHDGSTIGGSYFGAATLWRGGVRESLRIGGSVDAVSGSGEFAVGEGLGPHSNPEAFLWSAQTGVVWLGAAPSDESSRASDVSEDGRVVVGQRRNDFGSTTGFVWTAESGMVELQEREQSANERLVLATELCELGGRIFGTSPRTDHSSDDGIAFWDVGAKSLVKYGPLDDAETFGIVLDVIPSGALGVGRSEAGIEDRAVIWDQLAGPRSLQEVASRQFRVDLSFWLLETAVGISDDGRVIVGTGWYGGFAQQGYVLTRPVRRLAPAPPP